VSSSEHVLYQPLSDDEAAVLDLDARALYTLNATAKLIFERAREGASVDAIVEELGREFDAPEAARDDVLRFIADARARGLLGDEPPGG
jgi:hypothetical protein